MRQYCCHRSGLSRIVQITPVASIGFPPPGLGTGCLPGALQTGFLLFLEPVGVGSDFQGNRVMRQAIGVRSGDHPIVQHLTPSAEAPIAGQNLGRARSGG